MRAILDGGVEAQLRAIPGVVHVSVGLKQVNNTATDEFSIRVYVADKRDPASIPESERIPKRIQGVPTDVNQLEVRTPCVDTSKYRPLTGGVQITGTLGAGTFGCIATDQKDGNTVLLSCRHVIGGTAGDSVFQPDSVPADLIGTVKRGFVDDFIDAAIADIDPAIPTTGDEIQGLFLNLSNHVAGVTEPVAGMRVFKMGRTTGLTDGKIVDADATTSIAYDPPIGTKTLKRGILVQCTKVSGCCCCTCNVADKSRNFADNGDSGSALLSDQRMAVGLVVSKGVGDAFACRMSEVESRMDIRINRTVVIGPQAVAIEPAGVPALPAVAGGVAPFAARAAAAGAPPSADDDSVWASMQRRLEESPFGREIGAQVRYHLPEAINLVNHQRAVMVTWQRVQGPSFLAQWMNGVRNPTQPVPKEINGVTMNTALLKLAAVLKTHGSTALQQSIDAYGLDLMALIDRSTTVDELIENIDNSVTV